MRGVDYLWCANEMLIRQTKDKLNEDVIFILTSNNGACRNSRLGGGGMTKFGNNTAIN